MRVSSHYSSHVGQKSENEDAALSLAAKDNSWWAAIADGMGGHAGGRIASTTAIATVKASIESDTPRSIPEIFALVKTELKKIACDTPELFELGTTLSLVAIDGSRAKVGHVGDSRIYHLRNEGIVMRTVDQTEVQELIARGVLSKASARRYSRRNVLLSVLSPNSEYQLFEDSFEVQGGDRLVLTTDGVSSKVLTKELRDLSLECRTPEVFCERLMQMVQMRNPVDDYTAICLDIIS